MPVMIIAFPHFSCKTISSTRWSNAIMNASSRYTNILFIGLSDTVLGWYNVAILPALMLSLFVLGLYLLLKRSLK